MVDLTITRYMLIRQLRFYHLLNFSNIPEVLVIESNLNSRTLAITPPPSRSVHLDRSERATSYRHI